MGKQTPSWRHTFGHIQSQVQKYHIAHSRSKTEDEKIFSHTHTLQKNFEHYRYFFKNKIFWQNHDWDTYNNAALVYFSINNR